MTFKTVTTSHILINIPGTGRPPKAVYDNLFSCLQIPMPTVIGNLQNRSWCGGMGTMASKLDLVR